MHALTKAELVGKMDLFESLDEEAVSELANCLIARTFLNGDYIVRQGEPGSGFYFITHGRAKVEIERSEMKIPVAELESGDFFFVPPRVDCKTPSASIICLADTTCEILPHESVSKLVVQVAMVSNLSNYPKSFGATGLVYWQSRQDSDDPQQHLPEDSWLL